MLKKVLLGVVFAFVALSGAAFLLRSELMQFVADRLTDDMYVAKDSDAFDPGLAIGSKLPVLHASLNGAVVTDLRTLSGARGLVLFVNRSVDW